MVASVVSNPVPGDQLYVDAPLAVSITELPTQFVAAPGVMCTIGFPLTVILALPEEVPFPHFESESVVTV
jgi:hypothetical protein